MRRFRLYFATLVTTFLVVSGFYGNIDAKVAVSDDAHITSSEYSMFDADDDMVYDTIEADDSGIFYQSNLSNTKRQVRTSLRRKSHNSSQEGISPHMFQLRDVALLSYTQSSHRFRTLGASTDVIILLQRFII